MSKKSRPRKCRNCGELKGKQFFARTGVGSGRDNVCSACREAEQIAVNSIFHSEQWRIRQDEWWATHAEEVKRWQAEYGIDFVVQTLERQGESRRAAELRATPFWVDPRRMEEIYEEATQLTLATGILHHVDHIVPLIGPLAKWGPFKGQRLVCGLNWEGNLQILPARENIKKGNRFWPDMPGEHGEMVCYLKSFDYNQRAS